MSTCRATVSSPRIRETRPDRVPEKLVGALSFTVLYFAWILSLLSLYPEYVQRYCNVPDLLGIYVLGLLIDQLLFAATGGAIWSVAYEYLQGYRLQTRHPLTTRPSNTLPPSRRRSQEFSGQMLRGGLRWDGFGPGGREVEADKPFAGDAMASGFG